MKEDIINELEDWDSYRKISGAGLSGDWCEGNDDDFQTLLDMSNSNSAFYKIINNLWIMYTPNYLNWSNEKFNDNGFCKLGADFPLYAYPDRLIWTISCGGVYDVETETCSEARKVIEEYYDNK